jgi:hypothetical protein
MLNPSGGCQLSPPVPCRTPRPAPARNPPKCGGRQCEGHRSSAAQRQSARASRTPRTCGPGIRYCRAGARRNARVREWLRQRSSGDAPGPDGALASPVQVHPRGDRRLLRPALTRADAAGAAKARRSVSARGREWGRCCCCCCRRRGR